MRRRRVILAGLGAAAVAGCTSQPGDDPSTDSPTPTATEKDSEPSLVVDSVETPPDAIRLNDLGTGPVGQVPTIASLSDRRRQIVESALDEGYQTDELPNWLVTFVTGTPYVRREGTYYRLDDDFPQYELTARETTEAAVDGAIADQETYREAMTHDGVRSTALLRHARRGGITVSDPWPSLVTFVEEYDAVRFRGTLLSIAWQVTGDDPPYTVTAERVAPTELADEPVYDASEAGDRVREIVRAAGEREGVYAGSVPDRLLDAVASHQYVYLDGTFYWAAVEKRGALPVTVEATVVQSGVTGADEPRIRLALVNESDRDVRVSSGAPPPFGVLALRGPDGESTLWTDAYRENDHVGTDGRSVTYVQSIGVVTDLAAGERVERTFTAVGELTPGEYLLRDNVGVRTGTDDATLPYRVSFRVEPE